MRQVPQLISDGLRAIGGDWVSSVKFFMT